jgi:hypothetical protein
VKFLKGFGQFWYDFIVGDDWKIAAAVVVALLIGLALLLGGASHAVLAVTCAVLLLVSFTTALMIDVRS